MVQAATQLSVDILVVGSSVVLKVDQTSPSIHPSTTSTTTTTTTSTSVLSPLSPQQSQEPPNHPPRARTEPPQPANHQPSRVDPSLGLMHLSAGALPSLDRATRPRLGGLMGDTHWVVSWRM